MANIRSNDQTFASTQFRRLSNEHCERIHQASLEVLERTGVRLCEQEALDLLNRSAGVRSSSAVTTTITGRRRGQSLSQRAAERVESVLAERKPEPLPKDVAQTVQAIVERGDAEWVRVKGLRLRLRLRLSSG